MNDEAGTCSAIEGQIALYVGGDLDPATARALGAHLAGCRACRERAARAERARTVMVTGLSAGSGPAPDLWPQVRTALFNEGWISTGTRARVETPRVASSEPVPTPLPRRRSRLRVLSLAAGVLCAGFFVGRMALDSGGPSIGNGGDLAVHPEVGGGLPPVAVQPVVASVPERVSAPATSEGAFVQQGGLRRLAPGEARLIDSAELYDPEANWNALRWSNDTSIGSPASLRRPIQKIPPRH